MTESLYPAGTRFYPRYRWMSFQIFPLTMLVTYFLHVGVPTPPLSQHPLWPLSTNATFNIPLFKRGKMWVHLIWVGCEHSFRRKEQPKAAYVYDAACHNFSKETGSKKWATVTTQQLETLGASKDPKKPRGERRDPIPTNGPLTSPIYHGMHVHKHIQYLSP